MTVVERLRALREKATSGPWKKSPLWEDPAPVAVIERGKGMIHVGLTYDQCTSQDLADRDLIVAAVNALPALLDVAEAAEIVVAGFRRPQAVAPERWYVAMESMRAALAKLRVNENVESRAETNDHGDEK